MGLRCMKSDTIHFLDKLWKFKILLDIETFNLGTPKVPFLARVIFGIQRNKERLHLEDLNNVIFSQRSLRRKADKALESSKVARIAGHAALQAEVGQ